MLLGAIEQPERMSKPGIMNNSEYFLSIAFYLFLPILVDTLVMKPL